MGFGRLVLAACPDYDEARLRSLAVHAEDVYESASRRADLGEALEGFSLSAGFTRRLGERRKRVTHDLEDFAATCAARPSAPIGLVFGNERCGLSDEELGLCSLAVHIPTSTVCPSLNVAQAVQIATWEFAKALRREESPAPYPLKAMPAPRRKVDSEVADLLAHLGSIGFFRKSDESHAGAFLRDLCERAALDEHELDYLGKLFRKTGALTDESDRP